MILDLTEEQTMIRDTVRDFCEAEIAPIAGEIDAEMRFPEETIRKMGELGIMGVPFPEEYGGAGGAERGLGRRVGLDCSGACGRRRRDKCRPRAHPGG